MVFDLSGKHPWASNPLRMWIIFMTVPNAVVPRLGIIARSLLRSWRPVDGTGRRCAIDLKLTGQSMISGSLLRLTYEANHAELTDA